MSARMSKHVRQVVITVGIIAASLSPGSPVRACGGIFDVACNLSHGGLSPGNIARQTQDAVQNVANAVNELQASVLTGPSLEQAIIASRNSAINGSMPIPPMIRQQLAGYVSDDVLNRARYKIGDNGFFNLARLIEQGGGARAVTLIDVIIFIGPSEANDPALWAHELTHVEQYRDWGAHSFSVQYARNWNSVENPAYARQNGYWPWRRASMATFQPNIGNFCYTAYGRFGPGPALPIGSPCNVWLPQGNFPGQVGR